MINKISNRLIIMTIIFVVIIYFSLVSYGKEYNIDNEKNLTVASQSAVVLNAENNITLYSKDGDKKMYPASCTKLLTAIIALEECDLDETITVSENAVFGIHPESSHIALDLGEKITVKDAIYALLLSSANDAGVALAEHISGSVDKFAILMNKKAKEIGCKNSNFTNPHGLHEKNHYTTANDLALIMSYCAKNQEFLKIDSAVKYTIKETNKTPPRELWNAHRMIGTQDQAYEPVVGGKNGYVTESKFNLVTYAVKDNMKLVTVTLGNDDSTKECEDTKRLFEYYFNNYKREIIPKNMLNYVEFNKKKIPTTPSENLSILIPKEASLDDLTYKSKVSNISFPIKEKDFLANVFITYKGKLLGVEKVFATENINSPFFQIIKKIVTVLVTIVVLFIILVIILRTINMKKNKRTGRKKRRKINF